MPFTSSTTHRSTYKFIRYCNLLFITFSRIVMFIGRVLTSLQTVDLLSVPLSASYNRIQSTRIEGLKIYYQNAYQIYSGFIISSYFRS